MDRVEVGTLQAARRARTQLVVDTGIGLPAAVLGE
jgi:hypothetical protein